MSSLNLLYKDKIPITEDIYIKIPTIGEIVDGDINQYYSLVFILTAMPVDMMVALDDMGIDFTEINDYDLFLQCWPLLLESDTSLIFGDLDLKKFKPAINEETGEVVLVDSESDIVINRMVQRKIAATLRGLHGLEKNKKKPANKEAKDYMLERARIKAKRKGRTSRNSELERLIIMMVNSPQFKYDFESVKGISIYQFNESVQQVLHGFEVEHLWHGIYSGTVDAKSLKQDQLNMLKKD